MVSNTVSISEYYRLTRGIPGPLSKSTDKMLGLFEQVSTIANSIDHGIPVQNLIFALVDTHF